MSARRALSFGAVSEDYDRFRPIPAPAALDWLLPEHATAVADVGAGTGALTRLLAGRVAHVTAVEPDERMRRVLAERVPAATVRAGTGEALGLEDASQDAVLVSSAWHWVDARRAVPEAARVLRPGGRLGVLWTSIDREIPWVAELWRTLRPGGTQQRGGHGPRALEVMPGEGFAAVEGPHVVRSTRRYSREDLVGLAGTYSAMIVLAPERRAALLEEVRHALAADPRYREPVDVPVISRCYRAAVQAPGTRSSNGSGSAR
ncbi:MAG TPA: class I SAM-dependent methyltransferase [Solirubrobacteraceae bacterium]|nr:class I SAM-dependent methyltransferase [Solirubrobacteraceae bacterium]